MGLLGPDGRRMKKTEKKMEKTGGPTPIGTEIKIGYHEKTGMVVLLLPQKVRSLGMPVAQALQLAHGIQGLALKILTRGMPMPSGGEFRLEDEGFDLNLGEKEGG